MRRLVLVSVMTLVGCDEDAVAQRAAEIIAEVDPNPSCDTDGVIEVALEARRIACDPGTPCPEVIVKGTRYSCPAADPTVLLGVSVTEPGVYEVDRVQRHTTGGEERECLATRTIDREQIDTAQELIVAAGENSC